MWLLFGTDEKPSVRCAILAALLAKHGWGTPIDRDTLLDLSAVAIDRYPEARATIDELCSTAYVACSGEYLVLDNGHFDALADELYYECEWEPWVIKSRLKHYEGWRTHEWA